MNFLRFGGFFCLATFLVIGLVIGIPARGETDPRAEADKLLRALLPLRDKFSIGEECWGRHDISAGRAVEEVDRDLTQSLRCLANLGSQGANGHLYLLRDLLGDGVGKLNLACPTPQRPGHAPGRNQFPYAVIHIAPEADRSETRSFHQLLRTWYRPGEGVDYIHGCEICCAERRTMPTEISARAAACEICEGHFSSASDPRYWHALFVALEGSPRAPSSYDYFKSHLIPRNPFHLALRYALARAASGRAELAPLAVGMARYLDQRYPRARTAEFSYVSNEIERLASGPVGEAVASLLPAGRWLGEAYFRNLDHDWKRAISALRKISWPDDSSDDPTFRAVKKKMVEETYVLLSGTSERGYRYVSDQMERGLVEEAGHLADRYLRPAQDLLKKYEALREPDAWLRR